LRYFSPPIRVTFINSSFDTGMSSGKTEVNGSTGPVKKAGGVGFKRVRSRFLGKGLA
jgi:hypothetical protein